jgi:dipeptidyl aminopeptidase/acylaminoacyl peptidase
MAAAMLAVLVAAVPAAAQRTAQGAQGMTLAGALAYPFTSGLVASPDGKRVAWVREVAGVRNIFVADGPGSKPEQVTQFTADDGQELTQLSFSPDGKTLLFVRGGDHDGNWPAAGNLAPNPASSAQEQQVMLWRADAGRARPLAPCDAPAIAATGTILCIANGKPMRVADDGKTFERAFFDRGTVSELGFSPDGKRLAFVSRREGHAVIGVFAGADQPIRYLSPGTGIDGSPRWSPDGRRIAFTRRWEGLDGYGRFLEPRPAPWVIMVADAATGTAYRAWASGTGLRDSFPDVAGGANLHWAAGDRLLFLSAASNWQRMMAVPAAGGAARPLTADGSMVEHVALSPDGATLFYSANTGDAPDDDTRRHVFAVGVDGRTPPRAITGGMNGGRGIEMTPAATHDGVAVLAAGPRDAGAVAWCSRRCETLKHQEAPREFAGSAMVMPERVSWQAPDGTTIFGQLFRPPGLARNKRPGVVFVHGGPPRQMLLGFPHMRYYANAYALNQYLASRGMVVLSVNYRLGIGYGWDFQHPADGGPRGASEYQDVLSGARWLQGQPDVDAGRIGIWGGSYGGLLTAQALARNSDVFKAGVDVHGVHDWSRSMLETLGPVKSAGDTGRDRALATAWTSSPLADVAGWKSPVLLIHGDDDRNVRINQTIALAAELRARGVTFEELVIPNEIHDFLRHDSWARVDAATADYLERQLKP